MVENEIGCKKENEKFVENPGRVEVLDLQKWKEILEDGLVLVNVGNCVCYVNIFVRD